ncbi:MAG: C25 family cysteine peptidase, partial [Candidatus Neomarinimicrobiota bacterium]
MRLLKKSSILVFIVFNLILSKHNIEIINNSESVLTIKINNSAKTQADLFANHIFVGLPDEKLPNVELLSSQISNSTFPLEPQNGIAYEWVSVQKHKNLNVGILKINPIIGGDSYYKEIILKVNFSLNHSVFRQADSNEKKTLSNKIINWDVAKNWFLKNELRPRVNISNTESGNWISFDVKADGIKHLSYDQLKRIYMAIDDHDPRTISIYTSPTFGRAKSQETNLSIQENLIELPILFIGEEDGAFDPSDEIIFYAQGPSGFDINQNLAEWDQNLYFTNSKYWLFIPYNSSILGKRILLSTDPDQIELTLDYGISYIQKEIDLVNPDLSGLKWYGQTIKNSGTQIISTDTPNGKLEVDSYVELKIKGNSLSGSSSTYHNVELYTNLINQNKIGSTISWTGSGERTISGTVPSQYLNQINNNFFVSNLSSDNNSSPLIDYLYFRYGRKLIFNSKNLEFFSPIQNTGLRFSFMNELSENCLAFDISLPHAPKQIKIKSDNKIEVQSPENTIGRYIIFNKNAVDSVNNLVSHENITFSKLRNFSSRANYIIIGPRQFAETAQPLINLRQPAIYANLEDIYLEFSGGNKDPMAIRSFLQWTQENWASPAPIHLLLLGDAG